ncbi:transposase [Actinosynnema sp. CA-299493]
MQVGIADLEAALATELGRHPTVELLRSAPGLGPILAARVLAEIGDDTTRFATAGGPSPRSPSPLAPEPLRPTPRHRRQPQRRPAQPGQQTPRPPLVVPHPQPTLARRRSLAPTTTTKQHPPLDT